ncbi:LemA family protein [Alloalcanivorax mobilis]|uniref:LemA family protein n=1 Tax=Alloalcanivorax mobilis TaxID=2019569 RepID=UPI000C75C950|nr:LemA family protein [Alloalcanivorax mobilis]
MGSWLFFAVIVAALVYLVMVYNRLVTLRNRFKNAFAQIDVQLRRRHDLIPNLVETARAYLSHERDTLTQVIAARDQAASARRDAAAHPDDNAAMGRLGQAESLLSGGLARFNAVLENYPDLKADLTLSQLMEELTSTENRIGFARQAFNDTVMDYNTCREQFPNNFISGLFGPFRAAQPLEIDLPQAREAIQVSF